MRFQPPMGGLGCHKKTFDAMSCLRRNLARAKLVFAMRLLGLRSKLEDAS